MLWFHWPIEVSYVFLNEGKTDCIRSISVFFEEIESPYTLSFQILCMLFCFQVKVWMNWKRFERKRVNSGIMKCFSCCFLLLIMTMMRKLDLIATLVISLVVYGSVGKYYSFGTFGLTFHPFNFKRGNGLLLP